MNLRRAGTIGLLLAHVACHGSSTSTSRLQIAVVGNGATIPAAGVHTYATGTTVTVSAVPANGATFIGWTDDVASPASAVDVVVVGERTLVAHFSGGGSSGSSSGGGGSSSGGGGSSSSGGGSSSGGSGSSSGGGGSSSSGSSSSGGGGSSSSGGGADGTVSIGAGSTTAAGAFAADAYYSGGNTFATTHPIDTSLLTTAVPPADVLQHERWGNVTYTIPGRTPGSPQTVTLHFSENSLTGVGQRAFDVVINGTKVLAAFDIFAAAGGSFRAVARSFDSTADANGNVVIEFTGIGTNDAKIDGITVVGGTSPRRSLTVSEAGTGRGAVMGRGVDCGLVCSATYAFDASVTVTASAASGSTFAGWSGACTGTAPACTVSMSADQAVTATFTGGPGDAAVSINANGGSTGTFLADAYYSGGNFWATGNPIDLSLLSGEVPPAAVFRTERWGAFTYTIPDRTPSSPQRVILYFAESAMTAAGQRTFDVAVNGTRVLTAFDIFVAAGGMNRAIARSFDATANASGQVVIEFIDGAADHAKVNALTVVGR